MSRSSLIKPETHCFELGSAFLRGMVRGAWREWPLERQESGALTPACRARLESEIAALVARQPWQPRPRAWIALPARGVSLRRLSIPAAPPSQRRALLALQIESEFPLSPGELAWGHVPVPAPGALNATAPGPSEACVAAIRREAIEEFAELFQACGLQPLFTLAAFARARLRPAGARPVLLARLDRHEGEVVVHDAQGPLLLRALPWGADALSKALDSSPASDPSDPSSASSDDPTLDPVAALQTLLAKAGGPARVLVSGAFAQSPSALAALQDRLGSAAQCESLEAPDSAPAALRGLRSAIDADQGGSLLQLELHAPESSTATRAPIPWGWIAAAAALVFLLAAVPYFEAALLRPKLAGEIQRLKSRQPDLNLIDRKYGFLRRLQQDQPPYIDVLTVLAKSVPPGGQVESISMNRRGELVLRGSIRTSQEVVDFRSRLVDSGFFSAVVVEEQNLTPNRQQVNYRISARWKPAAERQGLAILQEPRTTNAPAAKPPAG